jgi:hypothetical protein
MTFNGAMAIKTLAKNVESEMNESAIFIPCLAHCQELRCHWPNIAQPWRMLSHYVKTCMYVVVGISPKRVDLSFD